MQSSMSELKKKTLKGMFWSAVERFSTQGVQFIFGIILARLLTPSDYGMIAMLTIFIAISQTFIDSGFANAVIRKIDRTQKDLCTVFFFNIFMSIACYIVIFCAAPFIARFYEMPELALILRVLGLRLIIQAFGIIQNITLTIKLDFKKQAKISLLSSIISGFAGIYFAYTGHGVWSLVYQSLLGTTLIALMYWFFIRWRPTSFFSKESFKYLFSFGSKLLASGLLDTLYKNIYPLVIGKFYSPAQLGGYSKAEHFAQFPSSNITGILQRVSFPVLSELQRDRNKLREGYLKFLKSATLLIFPLMMGLLALAQPLTLLLLTDKWAEMIILLQLICLSMMWYPVHAINLNLLQVLGRSDLFLKLEIIKKIIGILLLCITLPLGIIPMCIGKICGSFINLFINTYYSGKLMNAGFLVQFKFLLPTFLNSLAMAGIILGINYFLPEGQYVLQLAIGFVVGIIYYAATNYFLNKDLFNEMLSMIKKK